MEMPRPRSAGVTAAATFALLGSVTALLVWGYMVLSLVNSPADEQGRRLYETHGGLFLAIGFLPPLMIAALLRTAVGLFHLRPWARIAAMAWAATALLVSLWLIAFRPFETFIIPERFVSQVESFRQLFAIAFLFMLLPVSVWWLFLFRLKSVRAQFETSRPGSAANLPAECQTGRVSTHKAVS
jgi:hypothetical protein